MSHRSGRKSPEDLTRAVELYFSTLELPQGLRASHVIGYLEQLESEGASLDGLESAWLDLELFCAYLEAYPSDRPLDELEPWEFSRFLFEFLENEVFDADAASAGRKEAVLSSLVSFFDHLVERGELLSSEAIGAAFNQVFDDDEPVPIERPPLEPGEQIGWLNGPASGVAHPLSAADLWLAMVRDADFHGDWKDVMDHIDSREVPSGPFKKRAVQRLDAIRREDELDPIDLLQGAPVESEWLERARLYFYREPDPRAAAD